ncbi:hypothetical protein [Staphylococcus haemolyticus]|uniref:hypothetical protein n=1 Tax=Staphylococcus haemolyticus TaxID=1283 RepID=UPI0015FF6096|nr:hypothetical protein [Staphylococcus haemolyticus]
MDKLTPEKQKELLEQAKKDNKKDNKKGKQPTIQERWLEEGKLYAKYLKDNKDQ